MSGVEKEKCIHDGGLNSCDDRFGEHSDNNVLRRVFCLPQHDSGLTQSQYERISSAL